MSSETFRQFKIGFVSSFAASSIVYPIDVIKIHYQIDRNITIKESIKNIYKEKGVRGFYRGISSQYMTYPIFFSIFFQSKQLSSEYPNFTQNKFLNEFRNNFTASCLASLISNPFYVTKQRFQISGKITYFQLLNNIYKKEGLKALLKGYPATTLTNTKICFQLMWTDYMRYKQDYNIILASALPKTIISGIYYPFDRIRGIQRLPYNNKGLLKVASEIYQKEGLRGFYRGLSIYTLFTLPNYVIMMTIRDYLLSLQSN